jgi:thiamine pyrophosphokinase
VPFAERFVKPVRILIFANGVLPDLTAARSLLQSGDFIICADGGSRHARALGLIPDVLIGDLDSTDTVGGGPPPDSKTKILRHPRDKDETDLELALSYALERDPSSIVIVGALGGRIDHALGNVGLLADDRLRGRDCCLDDGLEQVLLCRDAAVVSGVPGDLVSLLAWGGAVGGITVQGLKWPLSRETLSAGRTRGISNEMLDTVARIQIETGLLLIVHRRVAAGRGSTVERQA